MERIQKFKRSHLIFITVLFCILGTFYFSLILFQKKGYILNISKSLPIGIYKTFSTNNKIMVGDIVVFIPNEANKKYMIERGYLAEDDLVKTLMKKVAGIEGDTFSVEKMPDGLLFLYKNGNEIVGPVALKDSKNRELSHISYLKLKKDEYFLIGESSNSYDSRYFGIVKKNEILYKAKAILTF